MEENFVVCKTEKPLADAYLEQRSTDAHSFMWKLPNWTQSELDETLMHVGSIVTGQLVSHELYWGGYGMHLQITIILRGLADA